MRLAMQLLCRRSAIPDSGRYSHFINSLFRFEHEVSSRFSYRLAYGIVDVDRNNTDGPGGPGLYQPLFNTSQRYAGRIDTVQVRANYLLGAHQVLTAGYEFEQEHYLNISTDQNPNPVQRAYFQTNVKQRTNAVFAQDELHFFGGRLQMLAFRTFYAGESGSAGLCRRGVGIRVHKACRHLRPPTPAMLPLLIF